MIHLFLTFLKIGAFTFGGGYAMLPLIQEEVLKNGWATTEEIINFVAVSESTPGPFAINMATYVGTNLYGLPGAAAATLGVVLPSFVIILIVAHFFEKFKDNRIVSGCMTGLKSAVIGLIAAALFSMASAVFFPNGLKTFDIYDIAVSAAIFVSMTYLGFKKLHPIAIIAVSAILGIIFCLVKSVLI
ncbi:MAG: chromate transporter [Clostridia bacterium]|nr:chromate transporter [Clostridia bacterium]